MAKSIEDIYGDDKDPGATTVGGSNELEEVDGKFLLLGVDNFDDAKGTSGMSSYLRLGAAAKNAGVMPPKAVPTGEDLAALVQGFTDDIRNRGMETGVRTPGDNLPPPQHSLNESTLGDGDLLWNGAPPTAPGGDPRKPPGRGVEQAAHARRLARSLRRQPDHHHARRQDRGDPRQLQARGPRPARHGRRLPEERQGG
jgi:hypothetical protein